MQIVRDINSGALKPITKFGGILGVLQSVTWIGLAITGISAHYCMMDFTGTEVSLATITKLTMFEMYFHGSCEVKGLPEANYDAIRKETIFTPYDINIILFVYLVLNFLWLISSASVFLNISTKHLNRTITLLCIWIFIASAISSLDLAIGIIFGIDYNVLHNRAYLATFDLPLNVPPPSLLSAQIVTIVMMLLAFKGFLLWITNVALIIYFFIEIFHIRTAALSKTSYDNSGFTPDHSILTRTPIHAFGLNRRFDEDEIEKMSEKPIEETFEKPYVKQIALPYEKPVPIPVKLEPGPIKRAHAMSIKGLREHFENRQKSIDKNKKVKSNQNDDYKYAMGNQNSFKPGPNVPDPDYSPAMPRVNSYMNNNNNKYTNGRY